MDSHQLIAGIERFASVPRLARYRSQASSDLDVATLYFWNIQLAESLMPAMALLEVALRNATHDVISYWVGTDFWFPVVLHPKGRLKFDARLAELTAVLGSPPSIGKIVAEMTFGFWSSLFTHYYHPLWWQPPTNPPLAWLLPHHPNVARDTRGNLAERLEYALVLRNRMMHHEPIFDGVAIRNKPRRSLDDLEQQIVETIGWLDSDASTAVTALSRFRQVANPVWKSALEKEIRQAYGVL